MESAAASVRGRVVAIEDYGWRPVVDLRLGRSLRVGRCAVFPNARLIAKQQDRDTIEHENRAFCEKHGMPLGTRGHKARAEDLMNIRANERQRTLADSGIF
jgi:hypothetical protein